MPNLKGRACNLDFPALVLEEVKSTRGGDHGEMKTLLQRGKVRVFISPFPALLESKFAAYFTGCQLFEPEKSIFEAEKSTKSRFWTQKPVKVDFKYRFFNLN